MKAVCLNTRVVQMKAEPKGIRVTFEGDGVKGGSQEQLFDRVLVCVGRRPNSKIPGLDRTRVAVERARLHHRRRADAHGRAVDLRDWRRRRRADACAQGVARGPRRRRSDLGENVAFEPRAIPAVVFTDPEIAWAGLTEAQAAEEGRKVVVSKFPWAASGRAITLDRVDGLTKLILDAETERILGVGLVGAGAGELIAEGVLAIEMGANATDLKLSIHPHPTLTETMMESAEVFFGQATHVFRPKR